MQIKTIHKSRKTISGKIVSYLGTLTDKFVYAWDFPLVDGKRDYDGRPEKRLILATQVYVKKGNQQTPSEHITEKQLRNVSVDLYNQKSLNNSKYGLFYSNWEIKNNISVITLKQIKPENTIENFL